MIDMPTHTGQMVAQGLHDLTPRSPACAMAPAFVSRGPGRAGVWSCAGCGWEDDADHVADVAALMFTTDAGVRR